MNKASRSWAIAGHEPTNPNPVLIKIGSGSLTIRVDSVAKSFDIGKVRIDFNEIASASGGAIADTRFPTIISRWVAPGERVFLAG